LEIKAAKYGLECPACIEMEIVEIKEKINALEAEVEYLHVITTNPLVKCLYYTMKSLKIIEHKCLKYVI